MSKYLFVGHDLAYFDFFQNLEIGILHKNPNATIQHIYTRPSAFLFACLSGCNAGTPFFSRFTFKANKLNQDEADLDLDLDLDFYLASESANEKHLKEIYSGYAKWIKENVIGDIGDTTIITSGEYRLFEQALLNFVKSKNVNILYFEAGPPGYIYLSASGVNANADFTQNGVSLITKKYKQYSPSCQVLINRDIQKFQFHFIFKAIDLMFYIPMWIISRLGDHEEFLLSAYERVGLFFSSKFSKNNSGSKIPKGKYYLFLGQVKEDVNSTHFGLNANAIEKKLLELTRISKHPVVMRPHPLQKIPKNIMDLCNKHPLRFFYDGGNKSLERQIVNSLGVVTVNSNGGLESLGLGKPVWTLGSSYYDGCFGVVKSAGALIQADNNKQKIIDASIDFIDNCFIPIDYRNHDFTNAQKLGSFLESGELWQ
jgi:capsule polysaccharide modification protein KpsS